MPVRDRELISKRGVSPWDGCKTAICHNRESQRQGSCVTMLVKHLNNTGQLNVSQWELTSPLCFYLLLRT